MQNPDFEIIQRVTMQRDQAVVCAALSVAISVTLLLSTFLGHRKDLVEAHAQIVLLENCVLQNQQALRDTEHALVNLQDAVAQRAHAAPSIQPGLK
jgi:uncharacterized protein YsxB (DUF464 family)